jgi:hypothetical protein
VINHVLSSLFVDTARIESINARINVANSSFPPENIYLCFFRNEQRRKWKCEPCFNASWSISNARVTFIWKIYHLYLEGFTNFNICETMVLEYIIYQSIDINKIYQRIYISSLAYIA